MRTTSLYWGQQWFPQRATYAADRAPAFRTGPVKLAPLRIPSRTLPAVPVLRTRTSTMWAACFSYLDVRHNTDRGQGVMQDLKVARIDLDIRVRSIKVLCTFSFQNEATDDMKLMHFNFISYLSAERSSCRRGFECDLYCQRVLCRNPCLLYPTGMWCSYCT